MGDQATDVRDIIRIDEESEGDYNVEAEQHGSFEV